MRARLPRSTSPFSPPLSPLSCILLSILTVSKWTLVHRQKRIQELQKAATAPRFGTVEEIRGSEFVQQVTNAGEDVWVVVHLYKEG